jgi:hypothetical protein
VYWELEMEKSDSPEMQDILQAQKKEANTAFFKYISKNYASWVAPGAADAPIMSHQLLQFKVLPHVEKGTSTFFILIDNLRFDQWKAIQPIFQEYFRVLEEDTFYSILPTATHYCRNAIFSGLLPIDIEKKFKAEWKNDDDEGGKNLHEELFFKGMVQGVIEWEHSGGWIITYDKGSQALLDLDINYAEIVVIGNIYENPELMEVNYETI